jgi:DNA-binding NarL/FixJ family response regulator
VFLKAPNVTTRRLRLDIGAADSDEHPRLWPRQVEILDLVGQGYSDKQIARTLGISRHTVRTHLERLFHTHGWNNRAQAATAWARNSLEFSLQR